MSLLHRLKEMFSSHPEGLEEVRKDIRDKVHDYRNEVTTELATNRENQSRVDEVMRTTQRIIRRLEIQRLKHERESKPNGSGSTTL